MEQAIVVRVYTIIEHGGTVVVVRRSSSEVGEEMVDALSLALAEVGLGSEVTVTAGSSGREASFWVGSVRVGVVVAGVVTAGDAERIVARAGRADGLFLVAAERIAGGAVGALRAAGVSFFDRRGRLRLVAPGVFVDAEVTSHRVGVGVPVDCLAGGTAREVALLVLVDPQRAWGTREIARELHRAPSTVSVALDGLRAAGLVTRSNLPLVPDLFWSLAAVWHRNPVPLAALPELEPPGSPSPPRDGIEAGGWVLTDTRAAVALGMPIVASSDYPPDFYVRSPFAVDRAVARLGRAISVAERACTVAVAPVPYVCKPSEPIGGLGWPVASHVVVALDLAGDLARGREVIEGWHPAGLHRAW